MWWQFNFQRHDTAKQISAQVRKPFALLFKQSIFLEIPGVAPSLTGLHRSKQPLDPSQSQSMLLHSEDPPAKLHVHAAVGLQ